MDHLDRHASPSPGFDQDEAIGEGLRAIRAISGRRGVLVGLEGQPALLELFATPAGLRRHLGGVLEAAALDAALLPAEPTPERRARRFVASRLDAPLGEQVGTDAGAGRALAARSHDREIRAIAWNDHLVHATVFTRCHALMAVV